MAEDAITGERARAAVAGVLQQFLAGSGVSAVRVARDTAEPPLLAYLTHFPRMSVVLTGRHHMRLADGSRAATVPVTVGGLVYVPANGWNLPDWSEPVRDLTFLFGPQHVGVSLIDHPGGGPEVPPRIVKTSVPRQPTAALQPLLDGLTAAVATLPAIDPDGGGQPTGPAASGLVRSIATAVLHAGLSLLTESPVRGTHKARRLYESIRLYVQENAHLPISRESVAADFGLTPNHVSRLFRQEGDVGFNETLNSARVDRAKFMLGQYGTSLKAVARHCGFATTAYFCRTFKKVTRQTPTEYRLGSTVPYPSGVAVSDGQAGD